jgi:hypothetical protein
MVKIIPIVSVDPSHAFEAYIIEFVSIFLFVHQFQCDLFIKFDCVPKSSWKLVQKRRVNTDPRSYIIFLSTPCNLDT